MNSPWLLGKATDSFQGHFLAAAVSQRIPDSPDWPKAGLSDCLEWILQFKDAVIVTGYSFCIILRLTAVRRVLIAD